MIAVTFTEPGGPGVLKASEVPLPVLEPGELLIEVEAAGVSRADLMQREGKYPPPPGSSPVLGLDVAGTVAQVSGTGEFRIGDRVCALVNGGGYAEYVRAPAGQVLPVPENWTVQQAATLPENLFTVYDMLVTRLEVRSAERVLIHGGTSGIGTTAIMLCRTWGAVPYVTAGSAEKCAKAREVGAEEAIDYHSADFVKEIGRITGGQGVNVVLDVVGEAYLQRNLACLAVEGRIGILATQGGANAEFSLLDLMKKRGRISAATLRARDTQEKSEIAKRLRAQVWPLLPSKTTIRPLIDATFPLEQASEAHGRMEAGDHTGKILLITKKR